MALGNLRQFAQFQSDRGTFYKVEIYDEDWAGASSEFDLGPKGFNLTWEGSSKKRWHPMHASNLTFTYFSQNATDDTFTTDLRTRGQGKIRIKVLRGTSLNPTAIYWVGTILTDTSTWRDESNPAAYKLKAVCGLALLKGKNFDTSWSIGATAQQTCIQIIQRMLLWTNTGEFFAASDDYLRTSVNWREDAMATAGTNFDPLNLSAVIPKRAYNAVTTNNVTVPQSAYNVLQDICKCFGARVYFSNGMWNIIQSDIYHYMPLAGVNGKYWIYDYDSSLGSFGTFDESYPIDNVDIFQLAGRTSSLFPPLKRVDFQYSNWGAGVFNTTLPTFYQGEAAGAFTDIGYVVSGLDITIGLYENGIINQTSGTLTGEVTAYLLIHVKIVNAAGVAYYLQTDASFGTGASFYLVIANMWDSTFDPGSGGFDPDTQVVLDTALGFATTIEGDMSIKIEHYIVDGWDGSAVTQNMFTGSNIVFSGNMGAGITYEIDNPSLIEMGRVFQTEQSTGNELFNLGTCMIGDGPYIGSDGMIKVYDGANWLEQVNENWKSFGTGDPERITKIASRDFLAGQNIPSELTNISCLHFNSDLFDFTKAYTKDSKTYIPMSGTLTANTDTFKGQLMESYFAEQAVISSDFTDNNIDIVDPSGGAGNNWEEENDSSNTGH